MMGNERVAGVHTGARMVEEWWKNGAGCRNRMNEITSKIML